MIQKVEVKSYWFFNIELPTHFPKLVTVESIQGIVAVFDDYISQEKYADVNAVKSSLFYTEDEALREFVQIVQDGIHFIQKSDLDELKNQKPELFL